MSIFRRKPKELTKSKPNFREQRPGHMALLTVDLERHPDYEAKPVNYLLYGRGLQFLGCDRDVEWRIPQGGRGASAYGVFDDELDGLVFYERVTVFPGCTFGWLTNDTQEQRRIDRQRENPDIL